VEEGAVAELQEGTSELDSLLKASGKCVLLDKLLPKLKAEGHRVLIFSQMVRVLDLLSDYLRERRYSHERLDGTVRGDLRQAAIDRFCKPGSDTFAFLLSTRAGGLGINLIAADTCIIFDSDWNPQNDVQAMARSHRIGQSKRVKVFRLVTRNTYESEMVERANRKLGLERAMNADRGSDGLKDGLSSNSRDNGPPQDRAEVDAMLKRGAHNIFLSEEDDSACQKFNEADIDEILQSSSTKVTYENEQSGGSVFSKAAFVSDENELDMDDPEFWTKILPELQQKDAELADYFLKRKPKQVKRLGMADEMEVDEHLDEAMNRRRVKDPRTRDEDDARRAARRALAHVWSKTERMNCERALLGFGYGRWGRIKEAAGGATKLRTDEELERFGQAFVCLCVGLPIAGVGVPGKGDQADGIHKARDLLVALGCTLPALTTAQLKDLEPYASASAGGQEYAERVHKPACAPVFMQRLILLKRLADAIEREAEPLATFRAPEVSGGIGREEDVPWSAKDDGMLLLGVYKHGYRAYYEIRDDPELYFTCRHEGVLLPPPLTPATVGAIPPSGAAAGYDTHDVLPVPAADAKPRQLGLLPAAKGLLAATFLSEGGFKARKDALLHAVGEQERRRSQLAANSVEWLEDALREQRGEPARRSKVARRDAAAPEPPPPREGFAVQLEAMWASDWCAEAQETPLL